MRIVLTVLVGSVIMAAVCFLAAEFALRPAASVVLSHYGPRSRFVTGIASRMSLVWIAGTGLPVLGLLLVGATNLYTTEFSIRGNVALHRHYGDVYSVVLRRAQCPDL